MSILRGCIAAILLAVAAGAAAQESRPAPGAAFRDCAECPELLAIPAGTFRMGAPSGDRQGEDWERPPRDVSVRAFALGKYEVTFSEYDACVADGGCPERPGDLGWGRGRRPVVGVNWDEAKAYAGWLSKKTGKAYRLASEAEWEYAARAGATTRFSWGDEAGRGRATCQDCQAPVPDRTSTVGSHAPNAFGLHDMHGNVWEWTEDCWNQTHAGAPIDATPRLSGNCRWRVIRGGSWRDFAPSLRASTRTWLAREFGDGIGYIGFRVARDLD